MRMIRMIDVMQRDRGNAGVRDLMREALSLKRRNARCRRDGYAVIMLHM